MTSVWYCTDCETRIDSEEIEDHEAEDHHVRGQIRPDRLLGNDPHNVTVLTDDDGSPSDDDDVASDEDDEPNDVANDEDEPNGDPIDEEVTD